MIDKFTLFILFKFAPKFESRLASVKKDIYTYLLFYYL